MHRQKSRLKILLNAKELVLNQCSRATEGETCLSSLKGKKVEKNLEFLLIWCLSLMWFWRIFVNHDPCWSWLSSSSGQSHSYYFEWECKMRKKDWAHGNAKWELILQKRSNCSRQAHYLSPIIWMIRAAAKLRRKMQLKINHPWLYTYIGDNSETMRILFVHTKNWLRLRVLNSICLNDNKAVMKIADSSEEQHRLPQL